MFHLTTQLPPNQTILDQLAEELCRHNRGLIIELPRWMQ